MTSKEAYKRLLLKVNRNDTNEGINILPSSFVLFYNSERLLWLAEKLKEDSDNVDLNDIQELLETDIKLKRLKKVSDYVEYELPPGVFRYTSSFSYVTRGNCKDIKYYHFDKNALNKNAFIQDEFTGPQFDYEEGPTILSNGKLKVFFKDFEVGDSFITYYREPKKIDIEGYPGFDGPSSTVNPDISDPNVESILNRIAIEIKREDSDTEGFQLAQNRKQSES